MKNVSGANNSGKKYSMKGTCAKEVLFRVENNCIYGVEFMGGCSGNAIGLSSLLEGMHLEELITKLEHVICGTNKTSCPSQLTKIVKNQIKVETQNA